jgi:hypothetical protein
LAPSGCSLRATVGRTASAVVLITRCPLAGAPAARSDLFGPLPQVSHREPVRPRSDRAPLTWSSVERSNIVAAVSTSVDRPASAGGLRRWQSDSRLLVSRAHFGELSASRRSQSRRSSERREPGGCISQASTSVEARALPVPAERVHARPASRFVLRDENRELRSPRRLGPAAAGTDQQDGTATPALLVVRSSDPLPLGRCEPRRSFRVRRPDTASPGLPEEDESLPRRRILGSDESFGFRDFRVEHVD